MMDKIIEFFKSKSSEIIVGLIVSLFTAISGFVIGQITAQPVQPTAVLKPDSIDDIRDGEEVKFSAEESQTNDGSELDVTWRVDGDNPENSRTTNCVPNGLLLRCRFSIPGRFMISVEVGNDGPLTARDSTPVKVDIKGGYITFQLYEENYSKNEILNIQREIINRFNWPNIQANVDRPIVLYDPDREIEVFAANLTYNSDVDKSETNLLKGINFYTSSSMIDDLSYLRDKFKNEGIRIVSAQSPSGNQDTKKIDGTVRVLSVDNENTGDSHSGIIDLIDSLDGFDGTISLRGEGEFTK